MEAEVHKLNLGRNSIWEGRGSRSWHEWRCTRSRGDDISWKKTKSVRRTVISIENNKRITEPIPEYKSVADGKIGGGEKLLRLLYVNQAHGEARTGGDISGITEPIQFRHSLLWNRFCRVSKVVGVATASSVSSSVVVGVWCCRSSRVLSDVSRKRVKKSRRAASSMEELPVNMVANPRETKDHNTTKMPLLRQGVHTTQQQ